ncbi:hypothetical protein DXG01_008691 [Tephrocybe rancida]|nr:hypothetical protein DXG01_008691 [Tephrocybe rancida]
MAQTYQDMQSLESKITLCDILEQPQHHLRHIERFAASVITTVTYGRRVNSTDEWIVKENLQATNFFVNANIPGKYLVEAWPWLLKLPRRLQWFRQEAEERCRRDTHLYMHLLNDAKARIKTGAIPDCLSSQIAPNQEKTGMTDVELAYTFASTFGAGIETTAASLNVFVLAMLHFPKAMKEAQAEIDRAIGRGRLPEFYDKEKLPYTNALIKETMRWRPVAVFGGAPHAVTIDDEYNEMCGKVMFPSPEDFRPERFLGTQDPRLQTFDIPFGFGRRICPGMHLARNSLFINISRILWAFDILPALSADGQPIIPGERLAPPTTIGTDFFIRC